MSLLTKKDFLTLFPNHIILAARFKANALWKKDKILCETLEEAERLNTLEGWKYDIFFTSNWEYKNIKLKADWTWRTKSSVIDSKWNIYAIIWDIDFGEKEREKPREYFPELTPTVVNKTKHWYHMYWLLKNPVDASDYLKRREWVEDKLVSLMGIDKKAKDITRVLRVPWFKYWADNIIDDVTIETVEYNPDILKTFDEYENVVNTLYQQSCWDIVIQESLKKNYKKVKGMSWNLDEVFRVIADIDVRDVLETLYPKFNVKDNGAISEWGRTTHWYKWNKRMNYINNFSNDSREERPAGWPFSVAYMYYNRRLEDTLRFFRDKYEIKVTSVLNWAASTKDITFEKKIITDMYINEYTVDKKWNKTLVKSYYGWRWSIEDAWEITPQMLSEWQEKVNVTSEEKNWKIIEKKEIQTPIISIWNILQWIEVDPIKKEIRWYKDWNVDVLIWAFLQPLWRMERTTWGEEYIIRIHKPNWFQEEFLMPRCWTVSKFREFLMKYWVTYPAKCDDYFTYVYKYIFSATESYAYTNKLWYQELNWDMVIISKTWTYVDEERKIFVDITDFDWWDIIEWDPDEDLHNYVEKLIQGYNGNISYTTFLAMILWVNAYYFRNADTLTQLPLVFVFWIAGTWKSFLLSHMFASFGMHKAIAAGSTSFIYTKNAKHYIPINMTEFRNAAHAQIASVGWVVRWLFDWTAIEKWRADQSVVEYESNAQYIFDWQSTFSDDALQTRMIMIMTKDIYKWDLDCLRELPNIYNAATRVFKDKEDFRSFISETQKWVRKIESEYTLDRLNQRIITNYAYLLTLSDRLGLSMYNDYVIHALKEQNAFCADDDIIRTYQMIFDLQRKKSYDYQLYKNGMVIHIIEHDLPHRLNADDLRSFIQTINSNFLSADNWLGAFALYVDFGFVFKKKTLHNSFIWMLNFMNWLALEPYDEDTYKALESLKLFLQEKDPHGNFIADLNWEINQWKTTQKTHSYHWSETDIPL